MMLSRFSPLMEVRFEPPPYSWPLLAGAIALLLPICGIIALRGRRRSRALLFGEGISLVFMVLSLSLVVAKPFLVRSQSQLELHRVIDVSKSIDSTLGANLLEALEASSPTPQQKNKWHAFAHYNEALTSPPTDFVDLQESSKHLDEESTDIKRLLRDLPHGGTILLATDGFATVGREEEMVDVIRERGLRVCPVLPDPIPEAPRKVAITHVTLPIFGEAEQEYVLRVTITNERAAVVQGVISVKPSDLEPTSSTEAVPPESDLVKTIKVKAPSLGIRTFHITFTPLDTSLPTSSWITHLAGLPKEEILIVSNNDAEDRVLKTLLTATGLQPALIHAGQDPLPPLAPERQRSIVINNVPATALSEGTVSKLQSYVQAGGRLIVVGGPNSFGLGRYQTSKLDSLLPVESLPPRAAQKRLSGAVVLVIDKSRSMADDNKLEYAKEAARQVIRNLKDDDFVGVIGFDSTPFIVVRLDQLDRSRGMALERIERLLPAGKTNLLPALDEARRALERVVAGRKHVIALTDGELPNAGVPYLGMVEEMRLRGITTSTVLVGNAYADPFLQSLAKVGGGKSYAAVDPSSLPRIFLDDVYVNVGEKTMQEAKEFQIFLGPQKGLTTGLASFPALQGFVETRIREGANLELTVAATQEQLPLLASWKRGKGSVIAFTSDASGRWSSPWIRWGRHGQFWYDVILGGTTSLSDKKSNVRFDLRHEIQNGELRLEALVYSDLREQRLQGLVIPPTGKEFEVQFSERSPGRYETAIKDAKAGTYKVALAAAGFSFSPVAIEIQPDQPKEAPGQGINLPLLRNLAEASNCPERLSFETLEEGSRRTPAKLDLRPWLLLFAALCLFGAVAFREANS